MKKTLLSAISALLISASTAFAFELQKAPVSLGNNRAAAPARAATADGYDIDFGGELGSWLYAAQADKITYTNYIYIDANAATELAGNSLTEITYSIYLYATTQKRNVQIFVSEDIDQEPVTATTIEGVQGANLSTGANLMHTDALEVPYVIKENTPFYFGYTVYECRYNATVNRMDYPIGIGSNLGNAFSGYVKMSRSDGSDLGTISLGEYDYSLFLVGKTVGEKKGINNVFSLEGAMIGNFILPTLTQLDGNNIMLGINNMGSNPVTSVDYSVSVNGGAPVANTAQISVSPLATEWVELPLPTLAEGRGNVALDINSVNGLSMDASAEFSYIALDNPGYSRKFVVEEGTGTWCGWCPRGIVGFETMEEAHPDEFIGIAVHVDDAMEASSYMPFAQATYPGFPDCIVNRDPVYNADPSPANLEAMFDMWKDEKAVAAISLAVDQPDKDNKTVKVKTTTNFAFDDPAAKYKIAFVILEDGIIGRQTNNYSGGSNGKMGGWENKASTVTWVYKHVARDIFNCYGLPMSVPEKVVKGEEYEFESVLSTANVTNIDKTAIVALLLDDATGTVLNAAKVTAANYGVTGISSATVDNAPAEYFSVSGMKVDGPSLPAGVYIKRQGKNVSKFTVK